NRNLCGCSYELRTPNYDLVHNRIWENRKPQTINLRPYRCNHIENPRFNFAVVVVRANHIVISALSGYIKIVCGTRNQNGVVIPLVGYEALVGSERVAALLNTLRWGK